MKKRKSILLGIVLTVAVGLSACAQKAEMKETIESVSEIAESVEETENNVADVVESESTVEETEEVAGNVTLDMDLSFLGEDVKELFVITNDKSKLKTRQEIIDYFHEKGCTFYQNLINDETMTYEDLLIYGDQVYLKPDDVLVHSNTGEGSGVHYYFSDWDGEDIRLKGVAYSIKDCSAETVAAAKEYFDNVLTSGIFDNCEYDIIHYDDDDADVTTWKAMDLLIKGRRVNPENGGTYFCCLSIAFAEEEISIGLSLM